MVDLSKLVKRLKEFKAIEVKKNIIEDKIKELETTVEYGNGDIKPYVNGKTDSNLTEMKVCNYIFRKEFYEKKLIKINKEYSDIILAFEILSSEEMTIIEEFYFKKTYITKIANILHYSIPTIYRMKKKALIKMYKCIYKM